MYTFRCRNVVEGKNDESDYFEIEFFEENTIKLYDIDSTYIDQLLRTYSANNDDNHSEIERAL